MKGCLWISISIDAADPSRYALIRKGGELQTVTRGIKLINQYKKILGRNLPILNSNATLFSYNIDQMVPLVNFCHDNNIGSLSLSAGRLYNTPTITEEHLIRNHVEAALTQLNEAKEQAKRKGIILRYLLRSIIMERKQPLKQSEKKRTSLGAYMEITIQPNLDVMSASENYAHVGNLRSTGLVDLWNHGFIFLRKKKSYESIAPAFPGK